MVDKLVQSVIIYTHLNKGGLMTKPIYSPEMVQKLKKAQPINFDKAQAFAKEFNKNVRSVIAISSRLGFYSKTMPAKKKFVPTKLDMVDAICKAVDIDSCDGLEKATGVALDKLLRAIS